MSPPRAVEPVPGADAGPAGPRSFRTRALLILWPAFVMAGVLEALVFVVVDPAGLHGLDAGALHWSASAVYSITFLIFWAVIATSGAITQLLDGPESAAPPARFTPDA